MGLRISGRHLVMDDSSPAVAKSQQDCAAVYMLLEMQPHVKLLISLNNIQITPCKTACSLGVVLDNQLLFLSGITNQTRPCQYLLYNSRRVRPFLSIGAIWELVSSLVILRLSTVTCSWQVCPCIRPLQLIQDAFAGLFSTFPSLLPSIHSCPFPPLASCIQHFCKSLWRMSSAKCCKCDVNVQKYANPVYQTI